MNEEYKKPASTEVLSPNDYRGSESVVLHRLHLPPGVKDMGLREALLGQWQYWGLRRTMNAYRHAVESGVAAVGSVNRFYEGLRELEGEKERWRSVETYREAARLEAEAVLERARAARNQARSERIESELRVFDLEQRAASVELLKMIQQNNLQAEAGRAQRQREAEEQLLAEQQRGAGGTSFQKKLRQLEQMKQDYEDLRAAKAADVEKYGSEEAMPDPLRTMYEKLEDQLADRDR